MVQIDGFSYESNVMSPGQVAPFIGLATITDEVADAMWTAMLEEGMFPALILQKRCEVFDIPLHTKVKLLGVLLCSSPGEIVGYLIDVLQSFGVTATSTQVIESLYPMGFYSEKGFEERWSYLKQNKEKIEWGRLI
jgi:hypothetical protein